MRLALALAALAALCTAGTSSAVAPPPPGFPLGPALQLKLPSGPGHAAFYLVTLSGTLAAGVKAPDVTAVLGQPPSSLPATVRIATANLKTVTKAGTATVNILVGINWFVAKRRAAAVTQGDVFDLILTGASSEWGEQPRETAKGIDCERVRQQLALRKRMNVLDGASENEAWDIFVRAMKANGCYH